nr:patatin-like phospholipase family protein [Paraburkholderia sp. UYCP14C]
MQIEGVSGTSAGAMNAAVLVSGFEHGGPAGARKSLEQFWRRVSDAAAFSTFRRMPFDMVARLLSPHDLNPTAFNPLRGILRESVDLDAVRTSRIKLFTTATHLRTGQGRLFRNADLEPDVLLASACLATLFKAVDIDGEAYWDGGYAGNPTITPLIRETDSTDTRLVQINPVERSEVPRSARDIISRLNEVAFNAPLLKELRMIALLHKVADAGTAEGNRWATMRIHRLDSPAMSTLGYSSKLNAEWRFLTMLHDEGWRAAQAFPGLHGSVLGEPSSLDLDALLDGILQ